METTATATQATNEKTGTTVAPGGEIAKKAPKPLPAFPLGTNFSTPWGRMELRKGVNQTGKWSVMDRPVGTLMVVLESVPKEKHVALFFVGMTPDQVKALYPVGAEFVGINSKDLKPYSSCKVVNHHISNVLPVAASADGTVPAVKGTMQTISEEIGNKGVIAFREVVETPAGCTLIDPNAKVEEPAKAETTEEVTA